MAWKSSDLVVRQLLRCLQSFLVLAFQEKNVGPRLRRLESLVVGQRSGVQELKSFLRHAKVAFFKDGQLRFDFPQRESCGVQRESPIDCLVRLAEIS